MIQRTSSALSLTILALLFGACAAIEDHGEASSSAATSADGFTEQDRLRGSVTPEREWWDVQHYGLSLSVMPEDKRIEGSNVITFRTLKSGSRMQVDLQPPLAISRVLHGGEELSFERNGNVYWVDFEAPLAAGVEDAIEVFYGGKPVESMRPPWSGGFTWGRDSKGDHFIATTCQGDGASLWWPNKDHGYDEPDRGI
ncbi:MAG: M1 family peptidase, partial [Planctomycetota bacterium]